MREITETFWDSSLEELKQGYIEETHSFVCLLCGKQVEKGIIYPLNDVLYEAERFMRYHIEGEHGSVFDYLLSLNKKLTGLTDHQSNLLRLFYEGKNDKDIQKELEIGSASTIRHHRFALKEKERQAKIFLTLMDLLKEKDKHAPAIVPPHKTANMLDVRYDITQEESEKVVKKCFKDGRLINFPRKEKQKLVVLRQITNQIDPEQTYSEKALNEILKSIYEDFVTIRRYLIEYGFLDRKPDGSAYWIKK